MFQAGILTSARGVTKRDPRMSSNFNFSDDFVSSSITLSVCDVVITPAIPESLDGILNSSKCTNPGDDCDDETVKDIFAARTTRN